MLLPPQSVVVPLLDYPLRIRPCTVVFSAICDAATTQQEINNITKKTLGCIIHGHYVTDEVLYYVVTTFGVAVKDTSSLVIACIGHSTL